MTGVRGAAPSGVPAVTIPRFGGPEVLEIGLVPRPQLEDGTVLVRVTAAAVSRNDTLLRSGAQRRFLHEIDPPFVPGMDLAGVVQESAHPNWKPGDRVMGAISAWRSGGGAQASLVAVPVDSLARTPGPLTDAEAATLPMNALTALAAIEALDVGPGDTIAVVGAAGAVGGYAVQIAAAHGVRVVADADTRDLDLVSSLGADVVIPRGAHVIPELPAGVDGLVDAAVAGQGVLGLVRDGGRVATVRSVDLAPERDIREIPVFVPDHLHRPQALHEIGRLAATQRLTPRISTVLSPERVAEAHRLIEAGGLRGRPVLDFGLLR